MRFLELRVPPLLLWAVFAAAIAAAVRWMPALSLPFPGHRVIALVLFVVGTAAAVAGVVEFRRARTTVNPIAPEKASTVVSSGVFRLTRNPMYLGMAVTLLGLSAWMATAAGLLLVPVFCVYMTRFQIEPEERALISLFGREFEQYMQRVRRWL